MRLKEIKIRLNQLANREVAAVSQRFFKTAPGQYGAGDIFIGIRVPVLREVAKEFRDLALDDLEQLLESAIHEERLLALVILNHQYAAGDEARRAEIFNFYLEKHRFINNWDLIDGSAPNIVGRHLFKRDKELLFQFARSRDLWERRIAIIACLYFIKQREFDDSLKIAELLLTDREDLIHKAVGWMLREIGKRDLKVEKDFLQPHYQKMPRTMLRYAIEKFPEEERQQYLKGKI